MVDTLPPSVSLMWRQHVIGDFLRRSEPFPLEVQLVMKRIFLCDVNANQFYDAHGITNDGTPEGDAVAGDWGIIPSGHRASKYFVANINALGRSGCFDAIVERVSRIEPPISLDELDMLMSLVMQLRFCYNPEFIVPYVAPSALALMCH